MDTATIVSQNRQLSGWTFVVDIGSSDFVDDTVTINASLDDDTLLGLCDDAAVDADDLLSTIFRLVLEKEPKESLPTTLDVDELVTRLPWIKNKISRAISDGSLAS